MKNRAALVLMEQLVVVLVFALAAALLQIYSHMFFLRNGSDPDPRRIIRELADSQADLQVSSMGWTRL